MKKKVNIYLSVLVILLSLCLFVMPVFAVLDKDEMLHPTSNNRSSSSSGEDRRTVTAGENSLSYMSGNSNSRKSGQTSSSAIVNNMSGSSISTISNTLKANGSTAGEAATSLIGAGYDTSEVKSALISSGYDSSQVDGFLNAGNSNSTDLTDSKILGSANVDITDDTNKANLSSQKAIISDIKYSQGFFADLGIEAISVDIEIHQPEGNAETGMKGASSGIEGEGVGVINYYLTVDSEGNYVAVDPEGGTQAREPGGLQHEYAHLVYATLRGNNGAGNTVLNEGFATYFGEQVGADGDYGADGAEIVKYKHALQKIASQIGQDKANKILIYSTANANNSTIEHSMTSMIKADKVLYEGAHKQNITNAFTPLLPAISYTAH